MSCRPIAEVDTAPAGRVLMLTAASTVKDRVDPATPPTLETGDVTLDPSRRVAFRAGRLLELSPKEFSDLECLLASADRVVSTEELLERVWKLGDSPLIETVREGGYRIGRL
jgi:hypothetical protein